MDLDQILSNDEVKLAQLMPHLEEELSQTQMQQILVKVFKVKPGRASEYAPVLLEQGIESLSDLNRANRSNLKECGMVIGDINRIIGIFNESDSTNQRQQLSLVELFENTTFERLIKVNRIGLSSNYSLSATRAVNSIMPIAVVSWDDFPVQATQYQGRVSPNRYSQINMARDRNVSIENHICAYLNAFDERIRTVYTNEVSPEIVINGSDREADLLFRVGNFKRAIGEVKCSWKLFVNQNQVNLIEMYSIQREQALDVINTNVRGRQEPLSSSQEQGVYWAICQTFGYMVMKGVKYGMLTTFNENWFLMHQGDGRLFVSPVVFCDSTDEAPDSPGLLRAYFYFLSLLLDSTDALPSEFVKNIKVTITDQARDSERKILHPRYYRNDPAIMSSDSVQSSGSTTSQATDRQVEYQFNFGNLGPSIGRGATGSVRVYRNYIDSRDGQVYPKIAIKFVDIGDSNERYQQAINEALIYKRLVDLQGICVPRLLFHCSMFPYYLIGMELIEGKPLDLYTIESVESKLRCHLDSVHRCEVIHNDLRFSNILVDKDGEVWLIDFAFSYIDEGISLNKANERESIDRMIDALNNNV